MQEFCDILLESYQMRPSGLAASQKQDQEIFKMHNYRSSLIVSALLLCASLAAPAECFAQESTLQITAATEPAPAETSEETAETASSPLEQDEFGPGYYRVGETIPAGEFVVFAEDGGGTCMMRTLSAENYSSRTEIFAYNAILIFEEGQYITLRSCRAVPVNLVNNAQLNTTGSGMFKIGMHIPAGVYTFVPDEGTTGSVTVYPSMPADPEPEPVVIAGAYSVRVINGQYVKLESCHFNTAPEVIINEIKDKETIIRVQAQLNGAGYDCGTPDGVAGDKTREAVSRFQEDHQMPVTGKIDQEFLIELDVTIPFSEVQAELGPYITDTASFLARYNEAVEAMRETQSGAFQTISEEQLSAGEFSQNEGYTAVLEINQAVTQVKTGFFVTADKTLDRHAVGLLTVFFYGIDKSFGSADAARDFVLRLLFDGSASSGALSYSVLPLNEGYNIWIRLPEAE